MRLVLDTNVLVSAFLWNGIPGRLIELAGELVYRIKPDRIDIIAVFHGAQQLPDSL